MIYPLIWLLDCDQSDWYNPAAIFRRKLAHGKRIGLRGFLLYFTSIPGWTFSFISVPLGWWLGGLL